MQGRVLEWTSPIGDIRVQEPPPDPSYIPIALDLRPAVTAVFSVSAQVRADATTRRDNNDYVLEHYVVLNVSLEDSLNQDGWCSAGTASLMSLAGSTSSVCRLASPLGSHGRFSVQAFLKHRYSQNGQGGDARYSVCDKHCELPPDTRTGIVTAASVH